MQRKGIRGTWSSPAGISPRAEPTGTKLDRDLRIGRLDVGCVPQVDSYLLTTDPLLGAYVGPQTGFARMESQINRPINVAVSYTDAANIVANVFVFEDMFPGSRKLILSQTLTQPGWDMDDSASGVYDSLYEQAMQNLVPWKHRMLSLRIGWEFNAHDYPWAVGGAGSNQTPANYAASFARMAGFARKYLPGVPIDWCSVWDHDLPDPWYPGDEFVDIVSSDMYVRSAFHPHNFEQLLTGTAGLHWMESFANTHGKLMAFPEWATDYDDGADIINAMVEWMRRPRVNRVLYQCYWNSNEASIGSALDDKPINLAAYKAAFAERS